MKITIFVILFMPLLCFGQVTWHKLGTAPTDIDISSQNFLIDSNWYLQGGEDSTGVSHKSTWQYKIKSNTWIRKNEFDTIEAGGGIAMGDTGYVIGGFSNLGSLVKCWRYDPHLDRWSAIAPLREESIYGLTFTSQGMIFTGMGYDPNGVFSNSRFSNRLWAYSPQLNTWTQRASLPDSGLREPAVAVVDSFVYVFGGHHFIDSLDEESTSDVWRYNAIQDKWDTMPRMPSARAGAIAYSFKNFILICFGEYEAPAANIYTEIKTDMLKFDLTTHQWSTVGYTGTILPSGFSAGFQYGSKCYLYGGIYDSLISRHMNLYEFDATPLGPVYAGVEEAEAHTSAIHLYPNPVRDILHIDGDIQAMDISVTDIVGRCCTAPVSGRDIDVSALPAGVYVLHVSDRGASVVRRFLIE
jgi:hypothetical protein